MKKIYLVLLIAFTFSSCEKDDICDAATSTTPRLIIQFYDVSNPTVLKSVNKLRLKADGVTESLVFNPTLPATDPNKYLFTGSKISLPIRTTADITKYSFVLNSGVTGFSNEDNLQINYTRNDVFVSRACGYKTVFTLNNPNGIVKTDATTPDGFWIQNIVVTTTNIETENETHVKIYF